MNSLSYMLWLANVIPSLGVLFGFLAVVGGGGLLCSLLVYAIASDAASYDESARAAMRGIRSFWKWGTPTVLLLAIISVFLPDRTTMHLILASELGEATIQNPEVIEIFDLLKNNLKEYLKGG